MPSHHSHRQVAPGSTQPISQDGSGCLVGVQLIGRPGGENALVRIAVQLAAAIAILVIVDVPKDLLAALGAFFIAIVVAFAITRFWKISIHTGVIGVATGLCLVTHPIVAGALTLAAALTGWSRVTLNDHTPAQVIGGFLVGVAVAAASLAGLLAIL